MRQRLGQLLNIAAWITVVAVAGLCAGCHGTIGGIFDDINHFTTPR